jgi:hypothetical protein
MYNLTNLFLLLAVLLSSSVVAQKEGILHITEAFSIRTLLDHRKSLNFQKERKLKAWSVQLLLSRDKYLATRKVVEVKKITKNITSKVDWFYQAPYYRIYAGAFYTKLEAATLLNLLIKQFPDAIVFKNNEARPSDM